MPLPVDLLVVSIPGLAAWMLQGHAPALCAFAERARQATLVVPAGCTPQQLEYALTTGAVPPHRFATFWEKAAARRPGFSVPENFTWHELPQLANSDCAGLKASLLAADQAFAGLDPGPRALVVVSAFARRDDGSISDQHASPNERAVLLSQGIEQPKTCMGLLEVAGLLQRTLTAERTRDEG